MACFLVVAGEAAVTTVVQKVIEKKEKQPGSEIKNISGLSWSRKLGWLNKMLWGGTLLLALEHVWHGEVVPWWPFLTAMENPADIAPMLHEMATVGGAMAVTVTVVWVIMVLIAEARLKASAKVNTAGTGV
ncbi:MULTISPECIES: hypothetical protein [Dehalococcoides]|mgnify:CR=1 FL=1|jgi:hypothetical protein|uniref:Uncharacterized protein n=2 Tax=Dehalococcoides mccartyi TaxID=61435 RepID=A0A1S6SIM4_9CHLR|nr:MULTISPECIES: hypothetical protein [Dehalococcoides]AGG07044.1 hypothetical protein dcmb_1456 [Dehalococcoides mccartyi DCMB5]AQW62964.1 hypothetical protein B1779_06855 [Dehalococcoides mccartyi]AQX73868.1 hypothetical protein B1775_06920 [Dehalococcoides mccartyi]RAL69992.1 hypothetical protein C1G86_1639 [Dehalococcoides mccartyi]CAI83664.1 hypothetical protein cbdbA1650 [Dehalococcoides mccartyi CBDB1]